MNKTVKLVVSLAVVVVLVGAAVLLFGNSNAQKQQNDTSSGQPSSQTNQDESQQEATVTIIYSDSGFNPSRVTVSVGDTVKIVNQSSQAIAPSSDDHPTHTNNPELNFGDIEPGQSQTIKVTKPGTWGIHDHYNADRKATIVVE